MDPVSAIGLSASLLTLIQALGKTVIAIRDFHDRWEDTELYIANLQAQLGTLQIALMEIQQCVDDESIDLHYTLQMQLEQSIFCCAQLLRKIDEFVAQAQPSPTGSLGRRGKAKVVFSIDSLNNVQQMLERQTSCINLLLTACSCHALAKQRAIIESKSAQREFQQVREESASLYVLRDPDSLMCQSSSRFTETSSKLSMVFAFDKELFRSRVYETAQRASIKSMIRHRRSQSYKFGVPAQKNRNPPSEEVRILVTGIQRENVVSTIFYGLSGEPSAIGNAIRNNIRKTSAFEAQGIIDRYTVYCGYSLDTSDFPTIFDSGFDPARGLSDGTYETLSTLFSSRQFEEFQRVALNDVESRVLHDFRRISGSDYLPTWEDVQCYYLQTKSDPLEVWLERAGYRCKFFDKQQPVAPVDPYRGVYKFLYGFNIATIGPKELATCIDEWRSFVGSHGSQHVGAILLLLVPQGPSISARWNVTTLSNEFKELSGIKAPVNAYICNPYIEGFGNALMDSVQSAVDNMKRQRIWSGGQI